MNPPEFLNIKISLPSIDDQQQIINIIEPKEQLFIKYNNLVRIDDINNFKKDWDILINIIEPFEKMLDNLNNRISDIKKYLVKNYLILSNTNSKTLFKDFFEFSNNKYNNQEKYIATSNISNLEFNGFEYCTNPRKSRANLSVQLNSFIFSKLIGENKVFAIYNDFFSNNFVYSTGFYNIIPKKGYELYILGFLLSDDFIIQKDNSSSGSVMEGLTLNSFKYIKINKPLYESNINDYKILKYINNVQLSILLLEKIINNLIKLYVN